jgi:hypothetical protein
MSKRLDPSGYSARQPGSQATRSADDTLPVGVS